MNEIVERVENNFINIYNKFDILDKKLNNYHIKTDEINKMIDIIISNEYTKIYKIYYPMKNYDLIQDRFFIYNAVINIPLKKDSYIIFEYIFNSEYINIPLIINLKIDNALEKDFDMNLKEYNRITHMFKLEYNITEIKFYLYLNNNEIYNDDKMEYLKKILFNNKKLNLIYFLLYRYMAYYYGKNVTDTVNDVKLKMQITALTLKLGENNDKIDDLLEVDKNIKNDISSNTTKIGVNETNISSNLGKIGDKTNISSNLGKIGDNETNISSNLKKINSIEENNLKISNNVFNDKYDIEKQLFSFNKNVHSYKLFEKSILKDNFNGELTVNTNSTYKYDNLENDINRLTHLYQFYDDKNVLFYTITLDNHNFSTSDFDENILNVKDNFCFNSDKAYNEIKIVLSLIRINEWGNGDIELEMINDNYITTSYTEEIDVFKKFDENDIKLTEIKEKISTNNNLVQNNFKSILPLKSNYVTDNIWLFDLNFIKDINFTYDISEFLIHENDITYNFKINSFIELNKSCLYIYDSLKNFYFI